MNPYIGEIRMFAGNFAPINWALCDGSLLPLSTNTALFSLLGTSYGGDGKSNFALPDLRSRVPVNAGTLNTTGTQYYLGEQGGVEDVTLLIGEIPIHTHSLMAQPGRANSSNPGNAVWAGSALDQFNNGTPETPMWYDALQPAGGNLPHDNMPPYQVVNFIIALVGVYPPRS